MSAALRHGLVSFKEQLERRQQERRTDRIAKTRAQRETAPSNTPTPITLSPDVRAFFGRIFASVAQDGRRYATPDAPSDAAAMLAISGDGEDVAAMAYANIAPGVHMQMLWDSWNQVENLIPANPALVPPGQSLCAVLLTNEINYLLQENAQKAFMPAGLLLKIKQSVQAFLDGRTNDTMTLLKNVLHNDPHNHSVLMLLSQVLYFLAIRGVQNVLPEARDIAQRSTIFSEKQKPAQLAYYRYIAIVTERTFSPERAMEWLRETGMLHTSPMQESNEGIMAERGIYLRCWGILAGIPVEHWQESELNAIKELVTKVIGGAAIYIAWLRTPLLAAASLAKNPIPQVEEIEQIVQSALTSFNEHAIALKQLPLKTSDKPWLLRVRFLNSLVQVAPLPYFDQVMLQVALDGQSWNQGSSPDPELRATLGLREVSYWRLWAMVLTPFKDVKQPYLMPAEETIHDGDLLASCDQLLATLATAEKALIKAHLWEDLKPWMVRWQLDHLLAASTGSNKPRMRFAPSLPPYTSLYRLWQDPPATGLLPSEIILENAKRGAFSSLFEVLAALDGGNRLINDPIHGLVGGQKRALAAANRYNPKKFKTVAAEFGGVSGNGLIMAAMPLGAIGLMAAVVMFSANWGQAVGLLLALGGVAGVVALNLKK